MTNLKHGAGLGGQVNSEESLAVDKDNAQFRDDAKSWWLLDKTKPDGNKVDKGGLAHRLFDDGDVADSREQNVFTFSANYDLSDFDESGKDLILVTTDNAYDPHKNPDGSITQAHFGIDGLSFKDFKTLVDRGRGVDAFDQDRDLKFDDGLARFGAPLHTKPVILSYSNESEGNVILSMTNDGYFHVSRANENRPGERLEYYAFIPRNLLKNIPVLADGNNDGSMLYGLDGGLTVWHLDHNQNGIIDACNDNEPGDDEESGDDGCDHAYAYFGMRRGGRAVYALDVTSLEAPRLLWYIDPDSPNHVDDPDENPFSLMGQSWAEPVHTRMLIKSSDSGLAPKDVIILSGGYDALSQDGRNAITDVRNANGDNLGHAIYIVDALTGELYWWASSEVADSIDDSLQMNTSLTEHMKWGITAPVTVVDISGDNVADMFFATDNGGQIWRFDISNQPVDSDDSPDSYSLQNRISGGRIADIQLKSASDNPSAENNRRFYYAVDVALVDLEGSAPYLTLAVGSGYRAHPLNRVIKDRFYVFKDRNIRGPAKNNQAGDYEYTTLYESDLLDVTEINFADNSSARSLEEQDALSRGWYISLGKPKSSEDGESETSDSGNNWLHEKVLSQAVTLAGNVVFTTYAPPPRSNDPNACEPGLGSGTAYVVRIDDARPVFDFVDPETGSIDLRDRKVALNSSGIPPEPLTVYMEGPSGNEATIFVGKENLPIRVSIKPKLNYWYQHGVR